LFERLADWHSAKQKTVTAWRWSTSHTEAELLALTSATKEIILWRQLFKHIGFNPGHVMVVYCDNLQTIRLLSKENQKLATKLRHFDIHRHWLKQEMQEGQLHIKWLPKICQPTASRERFIKQLNLILGYC
jgi:hypothetical protein